MDPQLKAIETIEKNVAVNAGAGTGKTKVLTERFVYILEHGDLELNKEVESIVAITFTKKATQEMVERIRKEIRNNFYKGSKWTRFYRDMEKSNISTIHSFCGKILRENPIEGKVDPLFEVLDDTTSNDLLNESIKEALDLGLEDQNLFKLMLLLKENRTQNLIGDIKGVYNLIGTVGLSFDNVKAITLDYLNGLKVDDGDLKVIKDTIIYLQGKLGKNSNIVKLIDDPIWLKFKDDKYDLDELFGILEYIKSRLGTSKKEVEYFELLSNSIDKTLIAKEASFKWLYTSFLDLLILVDELYINKKDKISGLDYDDLQIKVLSLLDNDVIRNKYQSKYKYIMIDEFQDTNELQKKIFYKLSTKDKPLDLNNLFVVGDPKQSIYAFRGADIGVFYNVLDDIKNSSEDETITLSKNYRTVDTVLDFINDIFEKLMGDQYDPLTPFHISENKIDIEILEDSEFDSGSEESLLFESSLIAKKIRELVDEGEYNYGDFALLFRATTRNYYYEEALKTYNIPYYNSSSKQFFRRHEILDIINALKSISNPYDTISTIGFLRGPMINLSDDTIFWLLKNNEESLFKTISKYIGKEFVQLPSEEVEKLDHALNLLDYFYSIKDICNISYLLERLLEITYFIQIQLLKHNGKQALSNIYKFIDIVDGYEKNNMQSLEDFIDYIDILKESSESEGIIESEDSDVVKLLTIHKSKGLQFPVVIIPEMSKDIRSFYPRFLFNKDIGVGVKSDENRGIYDYIKSDLDEKDKEEKKRILYVAMTRAKKMLILGNQGKTKGFKAMVQNLLDPKYFNRVNKMTIESKDIIQAKSIEFKSDSTEEANLPLLNLEVVPNKPFERYSISQFLSFKKCKRSYYLDYYKRLKISDDNKIGQSPDIIEEFDENNNITLNSDILALDKGNLIHKFCEHYNSNIDRQELLEKISTSYGISYSDNIYTQLEPYINNYISYFDNNEFDKVYLEKPFYLSIGDNYISGIIDRINIKDEMIEIVDLKTNRVSNKENLVNQYKHQLLFYAYAVERIMKMKVRKASVLFLESGEEVAIDLSQENVDNIIVEVTEFMGFVEANSSVDKYTQSENCNKYCKHRNICEGIG